MKKEIAIYMRHKKKRAATKELLRPRGLTGKSRVPDKKSTAYMHYFIFFF